MKFNQVYPSLSAFTRRLTISARLRSNMATAPQIYSIKELTDAQKNYIRASVPVLELAGLDLTKQFYNYMLTNYDEVKPFFNESNQKTFRQPKVLAFALLNYAKNIDDLTPLQDFVEQIVVKHVGLQVKAEHYPIVGNSLITTIKDLLGPEVATEEFVDAWVTAYGNLAQILINAEFSMYQKQPWQGFREFTVTKLVDECLDVKSVYFTPTDGGVIGQPLSGQYLGFRFTTDDSGIQKSREYSISDIPHNNEYRISVRKIDDGVVSSYIHKNLKVGDIIHVAPPAGRLTYQETEKDIVVFAGGIGITPLVSIIERGLADKKNVTLLNSNRSDEHRPFGQWLSGLQTKYPGFTVQDYVESKLTSEAISQLDYANKEVYLLGPVNYMTFVREELGKNGVEKVHSEFFGPTAV